jgi:hypothetical protein
MRITIFALIRLTALREGMEESMTTAGNLATQRQIGSLFRVCEV